MRSFFAMRTVALAVLSVGGIACASSGHAQRQGEQWVTPGSTRSATASQQDDQSPAPESKPESKPREQKVSGRVLDRDGNAISKVELRFAGPKNAPALTDSNGVFTFTGPSGDYVVTIPVGERNQEFDVKIEGNQLTPSTLVVDSEPVN